MTTTPSHPADNRAPATPPMAGVSRWQKTIGVVGLLVLFWVGDRLYTVIDNGGMGPARGHGPAGVTPTTQPTDQDEPPGGGSPGGHDPSQFGH